MDGPDDFARREELAHERLNGSQILRGVRVVSDDVCVLVGCVPCPMVNSNEWEGFPVAVEELVTSRGCRPLTAVNPRVHPAAHNNLTKSGGISVPMTARAFRRNDKFQSGIAFVENLVVSAGGYHA